MSHTLVLVALVAASAVAQTPTCSNKTVRGVYTFANSGTAIVDGNLYFFAAAGKLTADGEGNLEGKDTASTNGRIERRSFTGTYTVNEDCTGSVRMRVQGFVAGFDVVVAVDGKELQFIQTDPGVIISGTAKRQDTPPA
ncbi:MAG: hypothetical protein HY235_01845 [Acidobacteria bacterium]|nr:hypothetical protein [Acidobacteriota bacterium]